MNVDIKKTCLQNFATEKGHCLLIMWEAFLKLISVKTKH